METPTLIKELNARQSLWQLPDGNYIVVSTSRSPIDETLVFCANAAGDITDWSYEVWRETPAQDHATTVNNFFSAGNNGAFEMRNVVKSAINQILNIKETK